MPIAKNSNYTILQYNLLPTFKTVQAQKAFLWASERNDADRYLYAAEKYTREADQLVEVLRPLLTIAAKPFREANKEYCIKPEDQSYKVDDENINDLLEYFLTRHLYLRFPTAKNTKKTRRPLGQRVN